jgi:acetyl esterase/lipase
MMKPSALTLILTLVVVNVSQQPNELQDPDWIKAFAFKRIVYRVPGMERVKVNKNLTYKRVGGAELKMDVYAPAAMKHSSRRPAVMFIHGGRVPKNLLTTPKEWGAYVSFGQLVAASGFVGVTFNHRFYAWEGLNDAQTDVVDAIKYARDNSERLGVDPDRIILWAVSAGGLFLSQTLRDRPAYIRGLVAYYAALDLKPRRSPAPISADIQKQFSPVEHLRKGDKPLPPIFVARAGLDTPELNAGLDKFVQVALSENATIDVLNHATGHHGFDVEDDNDRSREIIKKTIDFIKTHSQAAARQ